MVSMFRSSAASAILSPSLRVVEGSENTAARIRTTEPLPAMYTCPADGALQEEQS